MQSLLNFLKNPISGSIFFFIIYLIFPIFLVSLIKVNLILKIFLYLLFIFITLFFTDILFSILYKKKNSTNYKRIKKVSFKDIKVESHPNLPFIYKKNHRSDNNTKLEYPLHDNFISATTSTNNLGYVNGDEGGRDIIIPKPRDLYRINCLGASTTQNTLKEKGKNEIFSYPILLEKKLKKKFNFNLEVNNCGTGGYTSADLLVRFLLQNIDTKPDLVILYHAYNDIRSYLTNNFESDYSHSRKNLGENYYKFYLGSLIPYIPINFINYFINKWLSQNHRYSLIDSISRGKINLDNHKNLDNGIEIYKRNLQNLITICKSRNIKMILCSFSFYLHDFVKDEKIHNLYEEIVIRENAVMEELAKTNDVDFIDIYNLMPRVDENFLDTIHLTPAGMEILAEEISKKINLN